MTATDSRAYALGHNPEELQRLDRQAQSLAGVTRMLLSLGGVEPGMHVLDMGSGTGQVASLVAELVGPNGSVVGVERSPDAVAYARERTREVSHLSYVEADVTEHVPGHQVDAVVCRLVLGYQPDPVAVLRLWRQVLRPGGLVIAMEYDLDQARSVPQTPLATTLLSWVSRAFAAVGQPQTHGPRLGQMLRQAGFAAPRVAGAQVFLAPDDPLGPALLSGVVRSLLPVIAGAGIASADEVGLDTLHDRIAAELDAHDAVFAPPPLVAGWARA